ncbi:MAG: sterol desaturase family protein [Planctomycetota bacterium]|nr:sterol desaturase family protein [Planctomycetota bacterium]
MEVMISFLKEESLTKLGLLFLLENLAIFLFTLVVGRVFIWRFRSARVTAPAPPIKGWELALALVNVVLNSTVTLLGLWLWRQGWIVFRNELGIYALIDVFVLVAVMDFAMYWLHRIAHIKFVYFVHVTHHEFQRVRPLTLFVLNPAENLGFGLLWLTVIAIYPATWLGMSVYLALNVTFGAIGHLGVEPFPAWWPKAFALRHIGTSTFHAQHHNDIDHNFGFYTLLWDRLFNTLSPRYEQDFGRLSEEPS